MVNQAYLSAVIVVVLDLEQEQLLDNIKFEYNNSI